MHAAGCSLLRRCVPHRRWSSTGATGATGSMLGHDAPRVVNEFRHNLVTDDWVVFSSARRGRPRQVQPFAEKCNLTSLPSHDATCPFCRGNEHETPEATLTVRYPGTDDWRLRVVPNKYPAVTTTAVSCDPSVSGGSGGRREGAPAVGASKHSLAGHEGKEDGSHKQRGATELGAADIVRELVDGEAVDAVESVPALGFHEVLIETPEHNLPTALMAPPQVEAIMHALQRRGCAMQAHRMRTTWAPHLHRCTAWALHGHCMCTACAPHVHRMCTACAPHATVHTRLLSDAGVGRDAASHHVLQE